MAMVIKDPSARPQVLAPEQRVVLRGVGWHGYEVLLRMVGDGPVRVTYLHGDAELMAPSYDHEGFKKRIARLIEMLTTELDIPCEAAGSTTWRREIEDVGLEPDECYYIANSHRVAGRRDVDLRSDPPPDLAIEAEISRSALNRMTVYAGLGVPEIWRFDGENLVAEVLREDGTYAPSEASPRLPFLPLEAIRDWLLRAEGLGQTIWIRQFRDWVRHELAPRLNPPSNHLP
jgi:Uma2 family endonuclease